MLKRINQFLALFKRVPIPDELKPVYNQRIEQIGAQAAQILTLLAAVLFSFSYAFDLLIIDPCYHRDFMYIRIAGTSLCLILFTLSKTPSGLKHGIALSFITLVTIGINSSVLIHTVGYDHSYYAMLNLIYLGAMVVPMTWELCLYACLIIFLSYILPIPLLVRDGINTAALANNAGFQVETIIVAVLYSHFHTRKRVLQIINEQLIINQRDQISQNLSRINELQESRQQFIQNLTHDLKTPLSIIAGHVDLVRSKLAEIGDESVMTFRFMADAVNQSTRLLDQLTSIAMLDSGILPSDMQYYDYCSFARSFCGRFSLLGEQYKVTFEVVIPENVLVVRMDLSWMERVIGNLIQNAFKHTPKGGTISVKVRQDAQTVVTEVHDTGSGIPKDKLPLVFERKYQAHEEDRAIGFGLGLSIVRNMIERMEGSICAVSEMGKGSIFSFTIPLCKAQDSVLIATPYPYSGYTEVTPSVEDKVSLNLTVVESVSDVVISQLQNSHRKDRSTILVCEDTPGQLYLLLNALKEDFNLFVARNGEEGMAIVNQFGNAVDLIISDVRMPVMDGIEFCELFFSDESHQFTPFILLTAYSNEHEHFKGLSFGATDYLQKPFNQRILREKINHWLMRRKHEQLLAQMIGELERKNEMISRFRSIISHEIRNPLTALFGIRYYLETLHKDLFNSMNTAQQKNWTNIEKAIEVGTEINAILDTATILEQPLSAAQCVPQPVGKVVTNILEQVPYFSDDQEIISQMEVSPETEVICDITMVRQVMINLLRNATEAVRETGRQGEVLLKVKIEDANLVISVIDTGVGMTDAQKANLFKYRATTKKDGNGIGLYLCVKLLQLQNGSISCQSTLGKGTTFSVKLPLAPQEICVLTE